MTTTMAHLPTVRRGPVGIAVVESFAPAPGFGGRRTYALLTVWGTLPIPGLPYSASVSAGRCPLDSSARNLPVGIINRCLAETISFNPGHIFPAAQERYATFNSDFAPVDLAKFASINFAVVRIVEAA